MLAAQHELYRGRTLPLSETGFHYRKLFSDNVNIRPSSIGNISQFNCLEAIAVSGIVTIAHTDQVCAILSDEEFGSRLTCFQFLTHQHQSYSPGQGAIYQIE
jgi:hypothetical protein